MDGVDLEIRSSALTAVAQKALKRRTGARGLRSILEYSLRDVNPPESIVGYWIGKILYWSLPHQVFIAIYSFSLAWVLFLWIRCPPKTKIDR